MAELKGDSLTDPLLDSMTDALADPTPDLTTDTMTYLLSDDHPFAFPYRADYPGQDPVYEIPTECHYGRRDSPPVQVASDDSQSYARVKQVLPVRAQPVSDILQDFTKALDGANRTATFTCGGTVPIVLEPNRLDSGDLTPRTEAKVQGQRTITHGVGVRWGGEEGGHSLSLPLRDRNADAALQRLIYDCQPATFGRGGKDVYDETYRRAGAMGPEHFMTDVCPYVLGIIDIVAQLLLPSVTGDLQFIQCSTLADKYGISHEQETRIFYALQTLTRRREVNEAIYVCASDIPRVLASLQIAPASAQSMLEILGRLDPDGVGWVKKAKVMDLAASLVAPSEDHEDRVDIFETDLKVGERKRRMLNRGIRAELYKLNVYSGPGGMFKPHVDTPRSSQQFGSLVICLPVGFQGGALAVRHGGQEVVHEWSDQASDTSAPGIQWAAFYSDCEHEVLPVQSGHRVTLTYNLFLAPGHDLLAGRPTSLLTARLPLVNMLQAIIADSKFLPDGGFLGIYLAHRYPHTHPMLHQFVPSMLKGSDMGVFEALYAVGLQCRLQPFGKRDQFLKSDQFDAPSQRNADEDRQTTRPLPSALQEVDFGFDEIETCEGSDRTDDEEMDEETWIAEFGEDSGQEVPDNILAARKARAERREVLWLNRPHTEELSRAYLVHGNQAELKVRYSSAALIVKFPAWAEREKMSVRGETHPRPDRKP